MMKRSHLAFVAAVLLGTVNAFSSTLPSRQWIGSQSSERALLYAATEDNEDVVLYSDQGEEGMEQPTASFKKNARWNSLSPNVKMAIIKEAQERAIANKKKREPAQVKKRRMMMFFKKKQQQKKRSSRVNRPISFDDRTPLADLEPATSVEGTVISLTNFGAYVDVGSECDGLLHVSQMTRDFFVEHPRQVMSPGDTITVMITSVNPERKKLHLSMLPRDLWEPQAGGDNDSGDEDERIPLDEIDVDDELWGEIKRVTDYGAYVELGAQVDGFLHFMDHPNFGASPGRAPPSDFMNVRDRIRVWVSDVDVGRKRIKLTANRPTHLPGPRRDIY